MIDLATVAIEQVTQESEPEDLNMLRYNAIKHHVRTPFEGHSLIRPGQPRTLGPLSIGLGR
ncbi:hypothetical protein BH683_018480 [Williamsia sp. 1138]|nr:hypothetical protein BH683_018480 [Williamsia sp. 1138]